MTVPSLGGGTDPRKVVVYARVSSERQAERDLPIAGQLKALRDHSRRQGWEVVREFVDEAESARSANRPAFKEMIALARQRQKPFDAILVWKLSRFARNREDSIIYKSLLRKAGVAVVSMNEQVDESPAGKLLEGMIEVIDEFYSVNLAQDTVRGMKENAARGFRNGGGVPTGYRPRKLVDGGNAKTGLEPDEDFAPVVRRIFRMCLDGMGAKEIVKVLNAEGLRTRAGLPWTKGQVYYILKNEVYTGTLVWNRLAKGDGKARPKSGEEVIRREGAHAALVDGPDFRRVQELLRERSPAVRPPRAVGSDYLLAGLIRCGLCGATMQGVTAKSSRFAYYACRNSATRGKSICGAKLVSRPRLESFVIDRLKTNVLTEENLRDLVRLTNEEIEQGRETERERVAALDRQLEDLEARLARQYDALETGRLQVEDVAPRIRDLKAQLDSVRAARAEAMVSAQESQVAPLTSAVVQAWVGDLEALLRRGSIIEQKSFLRCFLQRVEVNQRQVTLEYKVPLRKEMGDAPGREVLPFGGLGSSGRT